METKDYRIRVHQCELLLAFAHECKKTLQNNRLAESYPMLFRDFTPYLGDEYSSNLMEAFTDLCRYMTLPSVTEIATQERLDRQQAEFDLEIAAIEADKKAVIQRCESGDKRISAVYDRLRAQFERLHIMLDQIEKLDVTHAERRGQIKLFSEAMRDAQNAIRYLPGDIPF